MPGEESGAGRVMIAPDLYRVNGSLPITKSYHARGCGLNWVRCERDWIPTGFENRIRTMEEGLTIVRGTVEKRLMSVAVAVFSGGGAPQAGLLKLHVVEL